MHSTIIFLKERFSFWTNLFPLFFYFGANFSLAAAFSETPSPIKIAISLVITILIFIHLRIFDEIKDYKNDLLAHPERPLARGLISLAKAKQWAFSLIIIELVLSLFLGSPASMALMCTILYSILMYNEFFMNRWLQSKLVTYAVTHTFVSSFISLFIFSSFGTQFWKAPLSYLLFAFGNWILFNLFEFARKTFGKEEELPNVESYSRNLGSSGAAFLSLSMGIISVAIALWIGWALYFPSFYSIGLIISLTILSIISYRYAKFNTKSSAHLFRMSWSLFLLFYNGWIYVFNLVR